MDSEKSINLLKTKNKLVTWLCNNQFFNNFSKLLLYKMFFSDFYIFQIIYIVKWTFGWECTWHKSLKDFFPVCTIEFDDTHSPMELADDEKKIDLKSLHCLSASLSTIYATTVLFKWLFKVPERPRKKKREREIAATRNVKDFTRSIKHI